MKIGFQHIVSLFLIFVFVFTCQGKTKIEDGVPFLETRVDRNHTYEGERIIYEVILFSPESSVAGAEVMANPSFPGLDISRSAADSHLQEIEVKGKVYYTAVIDRFFIGTNTHGKYIVGGGDYRIGINRPLQINDPIWGPQVVNDVETFALSAPDLKISVDPLPLKNKPQDFSGAVGKFEVELSLNGEVCSGEDAVLTVTVFGKGDLTNVKMPEIYKSFGDNLHFKSMSDSCSHFIKDGSLGSEMEIECIFSADKPGHYSIAPVEFSFFDSESGKYVTVKSLPLEVDVTEGKVPDDGPPVILDV